MTIFDSSGIEAFVTENNPKYANRIIKQLKAYAKAQGMRTVSFELNGIRRDVQVPDEEAQKNVVQVPMADPEDKSQVGASIPGAVSKISVKVGDTVEKNQTIVTIEAMKMETAITARMSGTVESVLVSEGDTVKGGQLLLTIK